MESFKLDVLVGLVDRIPAIAAAIKPRKSKGSLQSSALRVAEVRQQVGETLNDCLESISYSILGGEYILDPGTEGKLIALKKKLGAGGGELEILDDPDAQELGQVLREEFYRPLSHLVKSYSGAIAKIQRKYTFDKRKSILGFEAVLPSVYGAKQSKKFQITQIIIRTIELDHLLSLDRSVIQELLEIREKLSSKRFNKGFAEAEIALEKANFLIRKIVMRTDHKGEGYYFTSNFKQVPFELRSFSTDNALAWDEDASVYYELQKDWKKSLTARQASVDGNSFKEKIFAVKALRQTNDQDLGQDFDEVINAAKNIAGNSFHHHAAQKLLQNYFTNCQFSHAASGLSTKDFFEEIEERLDPVRQVQIETVVLNFHPFKKATDLALEHLKKQKPQTLEEMKRHSRHLKVAQKLIKEYEDRLEWCKTRQFSEFLLPPHECIIEICKRGTFIASSMSLPIDYENEKRHLSRQMESLHLLANQEKVNQDFAELRIAANDAQSLLRKQEAQLESSQLKMIELLGAFTALFTIVVTNFGFFSSEKYSADAIFPFLLCLGLCSMSIMGFIVLIARAKNMWKPFLIWLIVTLLLAGLSVWYVFRPSPQTTPQGDSNRGNMQFTPAR